MTATTYTFHSPNNHKIVATAEPATLQQVAAQVAATATQAENVPSRFYVHNGKGIIATGVCKHRLWHDTTHEPWRHNLSKYEPQARAMRSAAGLPND